MKKLSIFVVSMFLFTMLAYADEQYYARVDVDGENTIRVLPISEECKCYFVANPEWKGEYQDYHLFGKIAVNEKKWTKGVITFLPEDDGEVVLILGGERIKDELTGEYQPVWVYFDDVRVKGAKLENGDFEKKNALGYLKGWELGWEGGCGELKKGQEDKGGYIVDRRRAASRNTFVKVWHRQVLKQIIRVTGGKVVKIRFKVKLASD